MAILGAENISRWTLGKGVLSVQVVPAGRTSASRPKATEAQPSRGAELEAMIETRRDQPLIHALGLVPSPLARHLQRVGRSSAMQAQRIVDAAPTPDSTLVTLSVVPARSARRATARRASKRRATARQRKDDIEGRIVEFLQDHPRSTTGDIAKGLNANRATIAAELSHIVRASDIRNGSAAS
jgi:hypothetical protein